MLLKNTSTPLAISSGMIYYVLGIVFAFQNLETQPGGNW